MKYYFKIMILLLLYFIVFSDILKSQNIVNNGNAIVISEGAYVIVGGNFINKTATLDGRVEIDGKILLNGNFENNSPNGVFINQEVVPNGTVIFRNSSTIQTITGTQPTHFENIEMHGSQKKLESTNSGVQGILKLDAVFNLNSSNFIIYNNQPTAISYLSHYILSETNTTEGYGTIEWKIGDQLNIYPVPFGSGNSNYNDLNLTYITSQAGSPSIAGIKFGTYPTIDRNNLPLPLNVLSLDPYNPYNISDRYWITDATSYSLKPQSSLILKYTNHDVESGNDIIESKLKAICASEGESNWSGIEPKGIVSPNDNTMSILNIPANEFKQFWTLVSIELGGEIWVPNAFTPNRDETNDVFIPIMGFTPLNYTLTLYNRWGENIFSTTNYKSGWNGIYHGENAQQDVYVWKINLVKPDGKEYFYNGHFTLIYK